MSSVAVVRMIFHGPFHVSCGYVWACPAHHGSVGTDRRMQWSPPFRNGPGKDKATQQPFCENTRTPKTPQNKTGETHTHTGGSRQPRQPQPHACPRRTAEPNATSPVILRPPRHMCTRIPCRRQSIGFASLHHNRKPETKPQAAKDKAQNRNGSRTRRHDNTEISRGLWPQSVQTPNK